MAAARQKEMKVSMTEDATTMRTRLLCGGCRCEPEDILLSRVGQSRRCHRVKSRWNCLSIPCCLILSALKPKPSILTETEVVRIQLAPISAIGCIVIDCFIKCFVAQLLADL